MRIITCTRCPASRTLSLDGGLVIEFFLSITEQKIVDYWNSLRATVLELDC